MLTIIVVSWIVWLLLYWFVAATPCGAEGGYGIGMILLGSGLLLAAYSAGYFLWWLYQHIHWVNP